MTSLYDFTARSLTGREVALADYRGEVLLIVNTASKCGFTPQYEGLEQLYRRYKVRGFAVLGFPCNQFGHQEPGDDREIAHFCSSIYGVNFPMFARIDVNGPGAHPLFVFLKKQRRGLLGLQGIKWNFTKFLVDRSGAVTARFAPVTPPAALTRRIEALL